MKKRKKSREKSSESSPRIFSPYWYYGLLLLVVLFFSLIRIRLRDMPLERDEGEYAYAGQLILQGIPPYQLAYNMKLPGTYAAYAAVMAALGQTPAGIHYGLVLVNAATTFLVFLLAARLFGDLAGLIAGASYALLSTSQSVLGFAGHATHFVVLPAVGGALLLLNAVESKRLRTFFLSGLLMGLAFVMKQPGMLFGLLGGLYILKSESRPPVDYRGLGKRLGAYSLGALLPFGLTCLIMLRAGLFQKFWFWTFSYASQYGTLLRLNDGIHIFRLVVPGVLGSAATVWLLAGAGLTAIWWHPKGRVYAVFVAGFLLFSFLAVCMGFYFRQHYFILMLPAVSLLVGLAISAATDKFGTGPLLRALPALVFLGAGVYAVAEQRQFFFVMDPLTACRETYGANPFVEAVKIAEYIKSQSPDGARIAVLGSEPEIYLYSRRRSATGYIYIYPLMEEQKYASTMQHEMTAEIEAARPEFVVFVDVPVSWLVQPHSDTYIFSWAEKYLEEQYQQVGIADIGETTEYRWGDEVKGYRPASKWTVSVYKRRVP